MNALLPLLVIAAAAAQPNGPSGAGERREDARLSPSLQPIADTPGLPRVLLIGDSISMGYTLRVREALATRANVHRPPTNCGPTTKGLAEIEAWLGTGHWDVIHFNFGLHDLKFLQPGVQAVPPASYEANLRRLVARLRQTGATLIWATTTPVPEKTKPGQYPRVPADIPAYNAIADRVMRENQIATNDLYAAVVARLAALQNPLDVHFNSLGSDVLGARVAAAIAAVLPAVPGATPPGAPRVTAVEPRVWACDFASRALERPMRFLVVLPEGAARGGTRVPVVYFLHGRGRHERTLLDNPVTRPVLLAARFAVVLPRGREGWYINAPAAPAERYADYLDEVIAVAEELFPVGRAAAPRAVGGWSMGGYGAAYTAGRRPGDFAALVSLIGLLDFPRAPLADPGQNYAVPARFGTDAAVWRQLNPRFLLPRLRGTPLFVACADQAAERQMNEVFIAEARSLGFDLEVLHLAGGHAFPMVEQSLPPAFEFLERRLFPAAKP